ncbi:hypothetical protein [Candidatus Protochlamydia phocaeensis]|uniref:hypothetical protein n=1 Tax=Candidatus Protochlamydia phocaeensis TaxID=1414722 RepID=UPI0008395988|nr:hypothetical protein [Candidatus Protochlamydia phocaeensis]
MLNSPHISASESNLKEKELIASFPVSATCSALKPKWLSKIANNRQHISHFISEIRAEKDFSISSLDGKNVNIETLTVIEKPRLSQEHLLNTISNLSLSLLVPPEPIEEIADTSSPPVQEKQLIQWLKEKGYTTLAERLAAQSGYPWDEIKTIRSPILIEQLVDLYLLCRYKEGDASRSSTERFLNFALNLAKMATATNVKSHYHHSKELVEDAKQVLGQLIFLINKDPALAIQAIETPHYNQILENLNNEFNIAIQEICHRLQDHYVAHYETRLQSPEIALHTMIPVEIAKALLTDIGTINVGIIDILSDIFLSAEEKHFDHEANLSYALKLLQRSPKLRADFETIHRPKNAKTPSNEVIRASLGLSPDDPINDVQARLTALIALLSHLRQGEDGSCFAVSLAIEILSAHLGFCLKDLCQLLHESKLTRHIKNARKDIPFVKRISDENINKTIIVDSSGCIIIEGQKRAELWEAPGIRAACTALGLKNGKEAILTVLQELSSTKEQQYEVSVKILLQKLSEYALALNKKKEAIGEIFAQACFAFSSQTSQPLLKVWENAIAGMAEAEEGSMIKTAILESTLDALQFKLGELHIPPSRLLQRFFLNIQKMLYERIRLQYDPTIRGKGEEDHISVGGFVLYQDSKRIDHAEAFRDFILNILLEVIKKIKSTQLSSEEINQLNETIDILTPYIDSTEFMGYLLAKYHPANTSAVQMLSKGLVPDYKNLEFTPWMTQTGNNSKAVLKVYLEADQPFTAERFVSGEAEEALANIIEMCKRMSEDEKKLFLENPNKLKPFCIHGKHRSPFMAGNPSLAKAWQQECPTTQWIKDYVLNPGKEIANATLDSVTKANLIERLRAILPEFLQADTADKCLTLIDQIPEPLTIQHYRQNILEICKRMHIKHAFNLDKIARQIDTALCQSLEPNLKKQLEDSAVHFADTNWSSETHDIHFCFAVNPGTGKLELWEVYSNGSHFNALDQNYWLFNQRWEFLTIPSELIRDDSLDLPDASSHA